MKKRIWFFSILLVSIFMFTDVNADSSIKLSMSCPSAAKPNTTITCKVYGIRTGSEIESVEEIDTIPTGALKSASYLIDYTIIPEGSQKNIGTVTVKTGNVGTGYIELVFDAIHFVNEDFQLKTSVKKKIVVNNTGTIVHENTEPSTPSNDNNNNSSNNSNGNNNNNTGTVNDGSTYLQDIRLSRGILTPAFAKNVLKYTTKVDATVDKITIEARKGNANQFIEGEVSDANLSYGKNVFKLVVSNGDSPKRTYEVTIIRQDNRDTNAFLSSLSLSSGAIKFDPNVFEYETKVLYDINALSILATPEKTTSTVTITGDKNLKVGENLVVITVKSQRGNQKQYKIKVTRLKQGEEIGDNANIKNIIVYGYKLDFDYNRREYTLLIDKEKSLNITVEMDDPQATYEIIDNADLEDGSLIKIVTTSHDGTASQTYTIEVAKPTYTIHYVIAAVAVILVVTLPLLFYFKYVKPKKELVDINGNKISKEELENSRLRKKVDTTIPGEEAKVVREVPKEQTNTTVEAPKYAVNITEGSVPIEQPTVSVASSKCPKCGRELLGTPSICPYCNTKLR